MGIHFGLRAHLGPLNADLRFDHGINENELSLLEQNGVPISGRIDTRSMFGVLAYLTNYKSSLSK